MKVTGKMISGVGEGMSDTPMVTSTMASSRMVKLMAMEYKSGQMEKSTMVNGKWE